MSWRLLQEIVEDLFQEQPFWEAPRPTSPDLKTDPIQRTSGYFQIMAPSTEKRSLFADCEVPPFFDIAMSVFQYVSTNSPMWYSTVGSVALYRWKNMYSH